MAVDIAYGVLPDEGLLSVSIVCSLVSVAVMCGDGEKAFAGAINDEFHAKSRLRKGIGKR